MTPNPTSSAAAPPGRFASFVAEPAPKGASNPPQRVIQVRRDYNRWVADETTEDYALRYTPLSARKWSEWRVANTAFGSASFLILEAVGATLLVQYGFTNAAWAILVTGLVIFLAGWPISVYAARYGLDMDLLTRGAGFGYLGSTITSLIYASFTFIFFALEAAVMAYALELAFGLPPAWGYLVCALVVLPLVTHGMAGIGHLQVWTQPLWLAMLAVPFFYVFAEHPTVLQDMARYPGEDGQGGQFNPLLFGAALTVGIALITQMGEQADYLRFMPELTARNRWRWWMGVALGGPGWVVLGVLKMSAGALLAWLAIQHAVPADRAVDPNQMYLGAWNLVFSHYGMAVAATVIFVLISQLKINVTNAYAGSLAWSNFFARLTHSHPGRVVWMVFNILIALLLMELNVFQAIGSVLGLYANVAIAWLMTVVADLVINKPLGWSPKGIEFKRAHLYDINPVGVGSMILASVLSVAAHLGAFGPWAEAFSALIAMITALLTAPLLAWATGGRYYVAREPAPWGETEATPGAGAYLGQQLRGPKQQCVICTLAYERDDMAHCPAYGGGICSLCCSLDARCGDLCKPQGRFVAQWQKGLQWALPRRWWPAIDSGLLRYIALMALVGPLLLGLFMVLYHQEATELAARPLPLWSLSPDAAKAGLLDELRAGYVKVFAAVLLVACIVVWWLVLAQRSRAVAQEESNRQTEALHHQTVALQAEIESHRRTDAQLQQARLEAERAQQRAEAANRAKTRYLSAISHELRTPLNSILGYAQLLEEDSAMPAHRRQAVSVIRRGGDHLLEVIESTLDLARIEGGRLSLEPRAVHLRTLVDNVAELFALQARHRGLAFVTEIDTACDRWVRADEKRVRQILINLLSNAVKYTPSGQIGLTVNYARDVARLVVSDSGPGLAASDIERLFEPFERGHAESTGATSAATAGTGLGLTITRMLTTVMGGDLQVHSEPGQGSRFEVMLFLPTVAAPMAALAYGATQGHAAQRQPVGAGHTVLVVDNEEVDRRWLADMLTPLGFEVTTAASGEAACDWIAGAAEPPSAVLMDLAMPGMDGWQTIARMRRELAYAGAVAIVSANAFERGAENDVGVNRDDFFVKPLRVPDLLMWLTERLRLDLVPSHPAPPASTIYPAESVTPPALDPVDLTALREAAATGYPRGVLDRLSAMAGQSPELARILQPVRLAAERFDFDEVQRWIASVETTS